MAKQAIPTLPSGLDKGDLTYAFTSSPTTAHLASELTSRDGIRPIAYNWADLSEEVQGLITKVWKLEELSSEELDKLPYEEYSRYLFDPRRRFDKPEALDGVRVLEVCRPDWSSFGLQFCGSLLAEHGAEVIKVEDPARGDAMRWVGPPPDQGGAMKAEGENWPPHGTSLAGFCENRNKFSVTLDITTPQGREMFKDLARNVDVVIENYDAGFLDSLGVGYRQLRKINPRLVYCGITGFGQFGEESDRKAFETATQAMGTLSSFTGAIRYDADSAEEAQAGFTPTRVGWPIGAISGGLGGAIAICGALLYRERKSGKGQMIDVSSYGLCLPGEELHAFQQWLPNGRVDQKREDALLPDRRVRAGHDAPAQHIQRGDERQIEHRVDDSRNDEARRCERPADPPREQVSGWEDEEDVLVERSAGLETHGRIEGPALVEPVDVEVQEEGVEPSCNAYHDRELKAAR